MFEEGGHVRKVVEQNRYFRLIFGLICLMSVILTNCYTGLMITELNAPQRSSVPKTFKHLVCNKLSLNETDILLNKHSGGRLTARVLS